MHITRETIIIFVKKETTYRFPYVAVVNKLQYYSYLDISCNKVTLF